MKNVVLLVFAIVAFGVLCSESATANIVIAPGPKDPNSVIWHVEGEWRCLSHGSGQVRNVDPRSVKSVKSGVVKTFKPEEILLPFPMTGTFRIAERDGKVFAVIKIGGHWVAPIPSLVKKTK